MEKNRWNRIMEDIKNGADDMTLKRRYGLEWDTVGVYRKYARTCRFDEVGEYADCVSADTVLAMASFNQIAYLVDMF